MLRISTDPAELDVELIHDFISQSYWAAGIPRDTLQRALANSVCVAGFLGDRQVAFARAVTDQATFAYIADVFVLESERGQGYGRAIVQALLHDPRLQGLRRLHLVTRDMHALYAQLGFVALTEPDRHMQKHDPDVYRRPSE